MPTGSGNPMRVDGVGMGERDLDPGATRDRERLRLAAGERKASVHRVAAADDGLAVALAVQSGHLDDKLVDPVGYRQGDLP